MRRTVIALAILFVLTAAVTSQAVLVEGTIRDAASNEPISRVTIRVEGTGQTMLGNDDGRYRIRLDPGTHTLRFSHVAHYSKTIDLTVTDRPETLDVVLQPSIIELPGTRVYTRAYDPAQRIIVEAIAHKQALLAQIHDYQYEAYSKGTVRKIEDSSTGDYLYIAESQFKGYFEKPDHYKQIITARRQSSNLPAEQNIMTLGRQFTFNENRIDVGSQAIVMPVATDALDYYNYYLLDTVLVEGRPAFRLEVEPKNEVDPLFRGEILIADSSYAVVGVDVGFNNGLDAPYIEEPHLSQRFARFENDIWWPVEVRFTGILALPLGLLPRSEIDFTAALNELVFNQGIPKGTFDAYVLEIASGADDVDSTTWQEGALIPLTEAEQTGYDHIDSLEHLPLTFTKALGATVIGGLTLLRSSQYYGFFHFTGVEGPYLGVSHAFRNILPRTTLYARTGWAFDGEYWQHAYSVSYRLGGPTRATCYAGFSDLIVERPSLFTGAGYNPTVVELWSKVNPHYYYLQKGFDASLGLSPHPKVYVDIDYNDYDQYSVDIATEYSIRGIDRKRLPNPPIVNGKMRSVAMRLWYDTRPLIKSGDNVYPVMSDDWTSFEWNAEMASPDLISNDFDFRRYSLEIRRYQSLPGLGNLVVSAYGGMSDRALPPQKYFTIDIGAQDDMGNLSFKTLRDKNFVGDRVLSLYASNDFGVTPFRRSGLPLVRKLPFTLSIYGGVFWSDFRQASLKVANFPLRAAPEGYSEAGFGIGRIPPILLRLYFTWQLSAYDTNHFSVKFGWIF